jgi:hypothetical protein
MRTHLGCTGSIELGTLSQDTQNRLETVMASWLEFSPEPSSLVVRHVQPDDIPPLREITGELLEFLSDIPDDERVRVPGGALYYKDEESGQQIRLKVWKGGFLTIAWARPDYAHAQWLPYQGQSVQVVFETYQRLNGKVAFEGTPTAGDQIRALLERTVGPYDQGEYAIASSVDATEVTLRDFNASVLRVVDKLREVAAAGTLRGEIDVTSFRAGDVEDYCRFVFKGAETWLVRPSLWSDVPESAAPPGAPLERAA